MRTPQVTELVRNGHQINPWVRANMEQHCPETEALIEPERRELYAGIMGDLLTAGSLLNEDIHNTLARKRFVAAQLARDAFFSHYIPVTSYAETAAAEHLVSDNL